MNCILYARVSTEKQAEKELSIPYQIKVMRDYARRHGFKIIGEFIDRGESAKTINRPQLKRLLQYCKEHKEVDVVLVHKIDRLARNLIDYATIKAILKQKGIRLISVTEPFDDNPIGRLLENIIASISEWYSANLGEEIKKAAQAKLMKGEWPQRPPIGYKSVKEGKRTIHVPDENTAPLVKEAFELFSTGNYSLRELSEEMYQRGLKTRYQRPFSPEAMKKLLKRRFYIGKLVWKGKEYQGKHQPIVEKELFYQVQEILKKRSKDTGEKGKHKFLLRGIAYCKVCGNKLTAEIHPRGSYYRCLNYPGKKKCNQPYIPVSLLDNQIEVLYAKLQPKKELLELLKEEIHQIAKRREKIQKIEIKRIKRKIDEIERKELKLLDGMLSEKIPKEIYEKIQKQYTEEKRALEARLSNLKIDYKDPLDFLDKCIFISSMLLYLHKKFNFEQRKTLLKAIFKKIYVQNKSIVEVELNPPFSILLKEDLEKVFKDRPSRGRQEDIFEQLIKFSFSEEFLVVKEYLKQIPLNSNLK